MSKLRWARLVGVGLSLVLVSCKDAKELKARIKIFDNPWVKVRSGPIVLAEHLNNPMSPRLVGKKLVFAEGGAGNISEVENGKTIPLINGFQIDKYGGYDISAQGITVDPATGWWIVAAAEGPGRILVFDPATLPTDAKKGREILIQGAVDDNPFATAVVGGGRILMVSGGTKSAYRGELDWTVNPNSVKPVFTVDTGLIGMAVDPKSGDVFGAVFGSGSRSGTVIRWDATKTPVTFGKVASGFTNTVDVAFTPDGVLLALEFGDFGSMESGRVSIVATDGKGLVTPFLTGLNNPTGLFVSPENTLYITEFGRPGKAGEGNLISLDLLPVDKK